MREHIKTIFVLLLLLTLIIAAWAITYKLINNAKQPEPTYTDYIVQENDNLWTIAAKHYPGQHTGEIVFNIRKVNQLSDATIYPGQRLLIPTN